MQLASSARVGARFDGDALAGALRRHELLLWLALAVGVAVALRAPWFGAPLGNDEGGLAYVARAWHEHGPFLYGSIFLDRPPLLVALFRLAADSGGTAAVRTLGAGLSAGLVLVVTLLARELGGRRAVPWAALLGAVLASAVAIGAVFTPAELPAALLSALSVLCLVAGHQRPRRRAALLAAAGALAVAAFMCKQSFADAGLAGAAYLTAFAALERPGRRAVLVRGGAYAAGVAAALAGLELWEHTSAVPDGTTMYALLGFRIDGLSALAGSSGGLLGRFADRLLLPLVASGLIVLLAWVRPGLRVLAGRPALRVAIAAWGAGGVLGVLGGGSYWSHYLIELVPVTVVCAALALPQASRRRARFTGGALAACALLGVIVGPTLRATSSEARQAATVGHFVHAVARPTDTIYVRYSQANLLYYSGLRTRYPYDWSLMLRTVPSAQPQLRALLRSPARRPTWVVTWEHDTAYGLDSSGATARLLARHYRPVATVCGHPLLLADGVHRPLPARPPACG